MMHLPLLTSPHSPLPLYAQIEAGIRALIIGGQLEANTLLPSIRELAADQKASVITIRRVYQDLENEGLISTRQGVGTFVIGVNEERKVDVQHEAVRADIEALIQKVQTLGVAAEQLLAWVQAAYDAAEGGNK